jgi:beta-glucosidase
MRFVIYLSAVLALPLAAQTLPFRNPDLSPEKRAQDLVSRLTLEEKVLQMENNAPAIPRLGIERYAWWNEALHGVANQGIATVFPQAIGLAATWNTDLMHRVADVISTEARAKYNEAVRTHAEFRGGLTFWSPNINIFRDPRWGRGQETYGEDPFLSGRMAVAFVTGMQGTDPHYFKVISTPKHYTVHSGPEPLRHSFDVHPTEYDLEHTYLPAFRAAIVDGKAYSTMCAYSAVNGVPDCASKELLQKWLRGEWRFPGYVVSDCGAVRDIFTGHKYATSLAQASALAVKAGTDLTCGTEYGTLVDAVKQGLISEAEINRSLERLFVARIRLGEFDPPDRVPYRKIPFSENDSPAHRKLALEAARESIVLLKNSSQTLPLKPSIKRIAVVGPGANDAIGPLGNYNGTPSHLVTPLEGIRRQFAGKAEITYAPGSGYTASSPSQVPIEVFTAPDGSKGLLVEYFDNPKLEGQPRVKRVETQVYKRYNDLDPAITSVIPRTGSSVRWTGTLHPPYTGKYTIAIRRFQPLDVYLDGKELISSAAQMGPNRYRDTSVELEAGHSYQLRLEYRPRTGTNPRFPGLLRFGPSMELFWIPPARPLLAEGIAAVKKADLTVAVVGISPSLEGEEMRGLNIPGFEGGDRTALGLPEVQQRLVEGAIATGKPVVVVLVSGSALAVNYEQEHAAAILEAWYGGEEVGTAIAETITGANNPAGRLPITVYRNVDQLPPFTDYSMKNRTYRYFKGDPLYPFGYGLSYSTFQYSDLRASRTQEGAKVSVRVKNTSKRAGDEIVQLYINGAGGPDDELHSLHGFQRIHLGAGETREVNFALSKQEMPSAKADISVGGGLPVPQVSYVKTTL